MAVDFEEIAAATLNITTKGATAQRFLKIAWEDITNFVDEYMGGAKLVGGSLTYQAPVSFPGFPLLILDEIDMEPMVDRVVTDGSVSICDEGVKVTLSYKTKDFETAEDPTRSFLKEPTNIYLSHRINGSMQTITHANSAVRWELEGATVEKPDGNEFKPTTVPDDIKAFIPIVVIDHELTWHNIPQPPILAIYSQVGTLNIDEFLGHAPGTVLFSNFSLSAEASPNGKRLWEVQYTFSGRIVKQLMSFKKNTGTGQTQVVSGPVTWDAFLRPDPDTNHNPWQRIIQTGDRRPLIEQTDFTRLFKFSQQ